jgi:hypothetical protein
MLSADEALDLWAEANEFIPEAADWGFFSIDQSPVAIGGFTWFPTKAAMLKFLWEIVPPAMANDSDAAVLRMSKVCQAQVSKHELGESTMDQLIEDLNNGLKGATEIQWVGTFGDMVSGLIPFCQVLRAKFHANRSESPVDEEHDLIDEDSSPKLLKRYGTPVNEEDLEDFREFLGEWGL